MPVEIIFINANAIGRIVGRLAIRIYTMFNVHAHHVLQLIFFLLLSFYLRMNSTLSEMNARWNGNRTKNKIIKKRHRRRGRFMQMLEVMPQRGPFRYFCILFFPLGKANCPLWRYR